MKVWRKSESGSIWLQPASNDALIYSPPEREDLIEEAIDCLDYAEEKLLELEYSPQNVACIRRLQATFVRLYELVWVLRDHEVFALVQRARAFLTYLRQGSIELERDDVSKMFELCSVLQELLSHNRSESHEEPLRVSNERPFRFESISAELQEQQEAVFLWMQGRLESIEHSQEARVSGRSPQAGSLFSHAPTLVSSPESNQSEDCFDQHEVISDSQELRSLKMLVSELDGTVAQLNQELHQDSKPTPGVNDALQRLLSLHQALYQRVDSLEASPRPTSSLFGLVIGSQDQYYCIPTSAVLALIPAVEVQLRQWGSDQTQVLWGQHGALTLKALSDFLPGYGATNTDELVGLSRRTGNSFAPGFSSGAVPSSHAFCVILRSPTGPCAIWVEHLLREMMVELKSTSQAGTHPSIKGGCQLPDGQPVSLLNVACLTDDQAVA